MNEDLLLTNKIINQNTESRLTISNKNTRIHTFFINSENRDKGTFPSPYKYECELPYKMKDIHSVKLIDFDIKHKPKLHNSHILDWRYNENSTISYENINTIEKINTHFNLTTILYGFTKGFDKETPSILFSFKNRNTILISIFAKNKSYDLFDLSAVAFPKIIKFVSLEHNIEYSCILVGLEEKKIEGDIRLKKVYTLEVEPFEYISTPFGVCTDKLGHILLYIYNPINTEILSFIPKESISSFKNYYFLKEYNFLIRHPVIVNNNIFNTNVDYNFVYPLLLKKPLIDIKNPDIYDIDIPVKKCCLHTGYIKDIQSLKDSIEKHTTFYDKNWFRWKLQIHNKRLSLEHYKLYENVSLKRDTHTNKIIIDVDIKKNSLIYIDGTYNLVYTNNSIVYFYNNNYIQSSVKNILVLENCYIDSIELLETINMTKSHKSFNNFKVIDSIQISEAYIYNTTDTIIIKTKNINSFSIGDEVIFTEENKLLYNPSFKYITKISNKNNYFFITICIGYILENECEGFKQLDVSGYLEKITYISEEESGELFLKIDKLDYIDILTNNTKHKTFAIIRDNFSGGTFSSSNILDLEKLSIELYGKNRNNIQENSMILEIESSF